MNLIKRFFLKKQKEKEYKQYIDNHKIDILKAFYEMMECKELESLIYDPDILSPLWYRALEHDDSKYEKPEFNAYRKHYNPIDKQEKIDSWHEYLKAREHHYQVNDHHWQYRQDWIDSDLTIDTKLICLETVLDWMATGYRFHNRPYEYYEKHKDKIKLPSKQRKFIEKIIYEGVDKKYVEHK